jgi:hypothetical protein
MIEHRLPAFAVIQTSVNELPAAGAKRDRSVGVRLDQRHRRCEGTGAQREYPPFTGQSKSALGRSARGSIRAVAELALIAVWAEHLDSTHVSSVSGQNAAGVSH